MKKALDMIVIFRLFGENKVKLILFLIISQILTWTYLHNKINQGFDSSFDLVVNDVIKNRMSDFRIQAEDFIPQYVNFFKDYDLFEGVIQPLISSKNYEDDQNQVYKIRNIFKRFLLIEDQEYLINLSDFKLAINKAIYHSMRRETKSINKLNDKKILHEIHEIAKRISLNDMRSTKLKFNNYPDNAIFPYLLYGLNKEINLKLKIKLNNQIEELLRIRKEEIAIDRTKISKLLSSPKELTKKLQIEDLFAKYNYKNESRYIFFSQNLHSFDEVSSSYLACLKFFKEYVANKNNHIVEIVNLRIQDNLNVFLKGHSMSLIVFLLFSVFILIINHYKNDFLK